MNSALALSGRIEAVPLADVLQIVTQSNPTGLLMVDRDDPPQRGELELRDGRIVRVNLVPLPEEPLGAVLLRNGCPADVLGEALRRQQADARWRPLGEVLLEMGALDQRQLQFALIEQVQQLASRILAWSRGTFRFYRPLGHRPVEGASCTVNVSLDPRHVVMEAARQTDERSAAADHADSPKTGEQSLGEAVSKPTRQSTESVVLT